MVSNRQKQILDVIVSYTREHGYPPTVRDIGDAVGLSSPSTVQAHLVKLVRAGRILRDESKPRAIKVLQTD